MKAASARKREDVFGDSSSSSDYLFPRRFQIGRVNDSERMVWPVFGVRVDATAQAAACGVRIVVAPVLVRPAEHVGKKALDISELANVFSRKLDEVKLIDSVLV